MKGTMKIEEVLLDNREKFYPVVPFDKASDKLLTIDFTAANLELTDEIINDTNLFTDYLHTKLVNAGALYGIGGYAEYRTVYKMSKVFDASIIGEEPRRLHLGIDIWGNALTPVMAPLEGVIHSFAFNNRIGDYGATIILEHQLASFSFFTLYGHLSLRSIENIRVGERIKKGSIFTEFGLPLENGSWPPHLHFQLISEIGNYYGDFPGVCKLSEKEKYLNICPDPDIVLQMMPS